MSQPSSTSHLCLSLPQHASADVEKMILGNKCDVNEKRQVSKERGEKVGVVAGLVLALPGTSGQRDLGILGFPAWRPALLCPTRLPNCLLNSSEYS